MTREKTQPNTVFPAEQPESMSRYSVYFILAGTLLVVASLVPVVKTAYRAATVEPSQSFEFSPNGLLSVSVDVSSGVSEVSLVLRLPMGMAGDSLGYSLEAVDGETILISEQGLIDAEKVNADLMANGPSGLKSYVEKQMPVIELSAGQKILHIRTQLTGGVTNRGALQGAYIELVMDPPTFRVSLIGLALLWIAGILLFLTGAIQWIRDRAVQGTNGRTQEFPRGEQCVWVIMCHLSALLGYIIPFGHLFGPAGVWVVKRNQVDGVDAAGLESLNFQLTVTILVLIGLLLSLVVVGLFLLVAIVVLHICLTLYASYRTQRGQAFAYPLNFNIVKAAPPEDH